MNFLDVPCRMDLRPQQPARLRCAADGICLRASDLGVKVVRKMIARRRAARRGRAERAGGERLGTFRVVTVAGEATFVFKTRSQVAPSAASEATRAASALRYGAQGGAGIEGPLASECVGGVRGASSRSATNERQRVSHASGAGIAGPPRASVWGSSRGVQPVSGERAPASEPRERSGDRRGPRERACGGVRGALAPRVEMCAPGRN